MIRFLITSLITIGAIYGLNNKFGPVPPIGKFLDPVSGFWANANTSPNISSILELSGLQYSVDIVYDELLIPHIFAQNNQDLILVQGYIHAKHRLWQMEFQTHAAAGRISEIVGAGAVEFDRGQRRKGMVFGADNFINNLDEETLDYVSKYAEGVNSYIESLSYADYPFEYKLMGYAPEVWTPFKSGLLLKYMADMLNSHERDMENTNFVALFGKTLFDQIYPDIDSYEDPIVDKQNQWGDPITKLNIAPNADFAESTTAFLLVDKPDPRNGSNNWAVGPELSATGNPLLCNDMHLVLNLPALWFYNQLSSDKIHVFGHSLPGTPFVITGFTDSIAWGFTNAQRDLVDWYKITYEDDSRKSYLLDGSFVPTTQIIEEIKIANSESYFDTVVYTIFGPVMYDRSFRATSNKNGFARRWIDHDPANSYDMFKRLNEAKNFDDYMKALDSYASPAQNIVFASVSGDIAHRVQGKYPIKGDEEGKFILDGTKSENNWSEYIPNDQNAFWINPERGFVSSANQHPADSTYPYYVNSTVFEAYRNRTINDVLRNDSSITVEDMKNLHFNNFSLKAKESLPLMLEYLEATDLSSNNSEVISLLKEWDLKFTTDSKAATFYNSWFRQMYRDTWDEINSEEYSLYYPSNYSFINLIKTDPGNVFFDKKSTSKKETAGDVIREAFETIVENTSDGIQPWSDHKSTYVQHLSRQRPLGVYNIRSSGNGGDVVNALGANHGPSERMIVELDPKGVKAWGHYPGGQSGNPGSMYYDNMIESWASGHYFDLKLYSTPEEASNPLYRQKASPK